MNKKRDGKGPEGGDEMYIDGDVDDDEIDVYISEMEDAMSYMETALDLGERWNASYAEQLEFAMALCEEDLKTAKSKRTYMRGGYKYTL